MVVAKAVARGVLIFGLVGSAAHAAPILTLATTSSISSGGSTVSYAPRYASPVLGLTLGTTNPSAYTPAPTTSTPPLRIAVSSPVVAAPAPAPAPAMLIQAAAPVAAPAPVVAPAPVMLARQAPPAEVTTFSAPVPIGQATADAFLNLGGGPYAAEAAVTRGGAQVWWNSPQVNRLFGGPPNDVARTNFEGLVKSRVERTFALSNVPIDLTTDRRVPAAHTLSLVSNTANPQMPEAIGMTQVGGDGFTFIDQAGRAANNVDQLAWIVAHNLAHELMLAFGVPEVHDATGNFIDARNASWRMMTDPNAVFSESAVRDLLSRDFKAKNNSLLLAAQFVDPAPVPEPTTIALWSASATALLFLRARRGRKSADA
ncbi:hypothetical protein TA3x_004582 [Tundrisphaera sp. TA3]|uniref:hypothetical protein n=1 Tax=Tundrisphaera sp. TA3 TaxID=3435775 RepID=UPI003EBA6122